MTLEQIAVSSQASDPYDGILAVQERRVETQREQETEREVMKAIETDPELATVQAAQTRQIEAGYSTATTQSRSWFEPNAKPAPSTGQSRYCKDCATGLIRIIRDLDDTVRHVNGEKCKRFHP